MGMWDGAVCHIRVIYQAHALRIELDAALQTVRPAPFLL